MAKFEVMLNWNFNPGMVNGSTEMPPADVLDENGKMMVVAQWPREPLTVEAANEAGAVEQALQERGTSGTIFLNDRIARTRIEELSKRPRPGSDEKYTSLVGSWVARRLGDRHWSLVSLIIGNLELI